MKRTRQEVVGMALLAASIAVGLFRLLRRESLLVIGEQQVTPTEHGLSITQMMTVHWTVFVAAISAFFGILLLLTVRRR